MSQGGAAVKSGQELERKVKDILENYGVVYKSQVKFEDCYNSPRSKMDFYIEDIDCAVECKRQEVAGTADQKLPFVLENLKRFPASNGLLILDGYHYQNKMGIHDYLNSKIGHDNFEWCFAWDFDEWLDEMIERTCTEEAWRLR